MTATADIITSEQKDALLVPNAALRFTPQTEGTPAASESGGITGALVPRRRRRGGGNQDTGASLATSGKATVYVKGEKGTPRRSAEHKSELQSPMRISYTVFCLKKKKKTNK